jgi:hypothetical protein
MNLTRLCSDGRCVVQYPEADSNILTISQTSTGHVTFNMSAQSTVYILPVPESLHSQRQSVIWERNSFIDMVIHKSLGDFRPLWYSSRDGHAEGEHVNRMRDTPSFCPTLQVLDMSTLADTVGVNPSIKFLPHTVNHVA